MQKIPTLFRRNDDGDRRVRPEVTPGCEWVIAGKGVATRKWDGTACMVKDGKLWKRYDAKNGKVSPDDFVPCEPSPDPVTGHWPGWVPVGDGKEDQWLREARAWHCFRVSDGTYEAVGPKINGNAEGYSHHMLKMHGAERLSRAPRGFETIKRYLENHEIEGLVYYHPDGRRAKIKRRDFGLPWPGKKGISSG